MKKPIVPTLDLKPLELIEEDTPLEISENVRYVNEMRGQRDVLLRVARAAYAYDYCNDDDIERKGFLLRKMREAIQEAEKLGIL